MLTNLNQWIQKYIAFLTPLSVILGVLLEDIGGKLLFIVPLLFAFMTFSSSLTLKFKDVQVFQKHKSAILFAIAFLHILMPLWAYFLSTVIFNDQLLTIGFVIAVAIPTGVTSVIWISFTRGNLPLGLSIVLIDTLLAPIIFPAVLKIVVGETVALDISGIIIDLLWMVVLPSILGIIINEYRKGSVATLSKNLSPFAKLSLFAIIMINSSAVAPYLTTFTWELVAIILFVFLLAASSYVLALLLGHFLFKNTEIVSTLVFIGGMRNIAVGVIIAVSYFPEKVAMPVVFGMLFQQVLASLFSKVVDRYQRAMKQEKVAVS